MIRYRVIYADNSAFGVCWNQTQIVESDSPISRKEIASRLNIDINNIVKIDVL